MAFAAGRGNEGQLGCKLTDNSENTFKFRPEPEKEDDIDQKICSYFTQIEEFGLTNKAVMASCGEKFSLILNSKNWSWEIDF